MGQQAIKTQKTREGHCAAGLHIVKGYAFPFIAVTLLYAILLKGGSSIC